MALAGVTPAFRMKLYRLNQPIDAKDNMRRKGHLQFFRYLVEPLA